MEHKSNLNEIIYEAVNEEYGWGKYGEFRVLIRRKDGYVNATKLCKDGGKFLANWNENKNSSILSKEVSSSIGIPIDDLFQVVVGGQNTEIRGTYVHQDLIPHIASWISPKFAIKVSRIVNNFIVKEYQEALRRKEGENSKLEQLLEESRQRQIRIEDQLKESRCNQKIMQKQLDLANENIIEAVRGVGEANRNIRGVQGTLNETAGHSVPPEHVQTKDSETYAIYFCRQDDDKAVYVQCRARPYHLGNRERELRAKFSQFRLAVSISPVPNARTLASEFERRIKEHGAIFNLKYQSIVLPTEAEMTEDQMVAIAREVFEERKEPAVKATEDYCPVAMNIDQEGKINVGVAEPIVEETEEPSYEERFSELLKSGLSSLKEVARAFPRNLKIYGGFSGKNKSDLVHWILWRQGYVQV